MKKLFPLIAFLVVFIESYSQQKTLPVQKIDSFISKTMDDWHVMGVSVAVIKKNDLIFFRPPGVLPASNYNMKE